MVGGAGLLNESAVALAIAQLLPKDSIVVHDGGQTMMWTLSHIQVDSPEIAVRTRYGPPWVSVCRTPMPPN